MLFAKAVIQEVGRCAYRIYWLAHSAHMNIRVFRRGESPAKPAKLIVSKSTAERLFRTGRYAKLPTGALQELTAERRTPEQRLARISPTPSHYIPQRMPPVDLPGLKFQEPQSDQWRIDHRTVKL